MLLVVLAASADRELPEVVSLSEPDEPPSEPDEPPSVPDEPPSVPDVPPGFVATVLI